MKNQIHFEYYLLKIFFACVVTLIKALLGQPSLKQPKNTQVIYSIFKDLLLLQKFHNTVISDPSIRAQALIHHSWEICNVSIEKYLTHVRYRILKTSSQQGTSLSGYLNKSVALKITQRGDFIVTLLMEVLESMAWTFRSFEMDSILYVDYIRTSGYKYS